MAAVFGAVLLCAIGLEKLAAPAGDAALHALKARPVTVTGTIVRGGSQDSKFALETGGAEYILDGRISGCTYAGKRVRVSGILDETTGLLQVRTIEPADPGPAVPFAPLSRP